MPAKAIRPILSPFNFLIKSLTANLDLSNLSGFTSVASILLDVSMAIRISNPLLLTSCHRNPHCGRINANTLKIKAATISADFTACFLKFTEEAISSNSSVSANLRIRAFFFLNTHTRNKASARTIQKPTA